jgi:hypothetical protein
MKDNKCKRYLYGRLQKPFPHSNVCLWKIKTLLWVQAVFGPWIEQGSREKEARLPAIQERRPDQDKYRRDFTIITSNQNRIYSHWFSITEELLF